ncbi:cytochrome P450 [Nonomuraea polychroma]|uniref:cytochrome P450 n=1 Tax=Nonomuraea polychroma TaxID=46176 RepID=UPI003D8E69DA
MTTIRYNPYDFAIHEDPYPTYALMREHAPLYRNDDLDFWALTRHADVEAAARNHKLYSNSYGVTLDLWSPNAKKRSSFISMDPPEHSHFRALISKGFTPRRVAELEPRIRDITRHHLANVLDRGTFDFVTDFAQAVPVDVISELIGVPAADRNRVLQLSNTSIEREDGSSDIPPAAVDATLQLLTYYGDLIAERRVHPADDLTSALIAADIDGERLSDSDIRAVVHLLGSAGNESTTKILANAWYQAARHPVERAKAWAGAIPQWVEETLRYDSSGQLVARYVNADATWYGTTIPAGSRLLLIFAAANRDPRVYADADQYNLDRYSPGHNSPPPLAFGTGPHFCLGAALARLETRIILEELAAVLHEDYDVGQPRRVHHGNLRGMASLPTTVKPR